ncbi:TIGR03013 family PEP-CTERM/XrtA system glycosyltransferase [Vibrio sp. TH_r3]|uniref:TIGR03013 family XrtA/PEP-CTERM system glycosyltransferase n=1 Tax=Vibrio sp. TH_r3 TaxID=3082084 RepID=UPI002952D677|nr:TIGR03013 family XrtA/PEP-CTERM system glycosyltransferase [Vibrio sp. TH_r3]MDV7102894.1 TIGR03013 family PEP-CTERM/XrtA system glycosyltransferase [Vibrio sp. TH_r3]
MGESHFRELKTSSVIIILTDLIVLTAIFLINATIFSNYYNSSNIDDLLATNDIFHTFIIQLLVIAPVVLLSVFAVGLYNEKLRETFNGIIVRILVSITSAYLITIIIFKVTVIKDLPGYFNEVYFFSIFALFVLSRFIISKTQFKQIGSRRVLVLGAGKRATIIEKSMRRQADRVGIKFIGFVAMPGDCSEDGLKRETIIELDESLEIFATKNNVAEIVIASDERRNVLPNQKLFKCKQLGIRVTDIIDFVEKETGQVAVNHIYPSWMIYSKRTTTNTAQLIFEWAFNCALALFIFSLTFPLMIITVIAIKLEEGLKAPIIYSQKRTGLNGKLFDIYKFRSMRTDAEQNGAQWAVKQDPRTTKVGNFIRKYRVDELPQLYNVIKGDMGFVGPRPERPQFSDDFETSIPYYNHRLNVKPGLTGWAQLKYPYGSSQEDALEKLKYDLYYIKNRAFLFDLLILLRTAEIILFGKGR